MQHRQCCHHYLLTILVTISVSLMFLYNYPAQQNITSASSETLLLAAPPASDASGTTSNNVEAAPSAVSSVKSIVAFSFRKQVELERAEVDCGPPDVDDERGDDSGSVVRTEWLENDNKWVNVPNSTVYVYSGYPDGRIQDYAFYRFIGMIKDAKVFQQKIYCHLSGGGIRTMVYEATVTTIWAKIWTNNDPTVPVLISCPYHDPNAERISLSTQPCKPHSVVTTKLTAVNVKSKSARSQFRIAICVKPLELPKSAIIAVQRLLAWIELNRLLGANYIDIYVNSVSKKVAKMLKWYQDVRTFVRVHRYNAFHVNATPSYTKSLWQKRKNEIVTYNDCLYRNLGDVDLIVPLDIDEVLVPTKHDSFQELLAHLLRTRPELFNQYASFSARHAFYFMPDSDDDITRVSLRTQFSAPFRSVKSFVLVRSALSVFNHYALHALMPGVRKTVMLDAALAQLNHYRAACDRRLLPDDCALALRSNSSRTYAPVLERYAHALRQRVAETQRRLAPVLNGK